MSEIRVPTAATESRPYYLAAEVQFPSSLWTDVHVRRLGWDEGDRHSYIARHVSPERARLAALRVCELLNDSEEQILKTYGGMGA